MSPSAPDLEALRAEARSWLASNPAPEPDFERPTSVMTVSGEPQLEYLRAWQRRAYDAGFVGVEWPEEYGGRGLPRGAQRSIDQEFGRAGTPPLLNIVALNWAGPIILRHGSAAQKQRFIQPLLRCDEIWCQGFSEPGAGSDLASLQARAWREGDAYVIEGHKVWTTLGLYADYMILLARTNPDEPRHGGISYFLSPMRVPGIEVQPLVKITGELGFNQVIFSEARIPADALLGREGEGWKLAIETLQFERGAEEGGGGSSGGGRSGAVEDLIEMARGRERDGRPLLDDPVVRDRIAAFAIEATAIRASRERLRVPGLVVDRPMALPLMTKLVGSELGQRLYDFACELQGWDETLARGDTEAVGGGAWQHGYLSSFEGTIAGGTSEIQRNILGEKVLGLPKGR
jgi:alkylation response protein AidB-like acyl-CoA dehydrogenase